MTGKIDSAWRRACVAILLVFLSACGGGGGGGGGTLYTISVKVTGFTSGTLGLLNNGGDNLSLIATPSGDITGQFIVTLADGQSYNVTVKQSTGFYCSVSNGTGTIHSDITINVSCSDTLTISGSVTGLKSAHSVVLANGSDKKTLTSDGSFSFTIPLGGSYTITVDSVTPSDQSCTVSNGSGSNVLTPVSNVGVNCSDITISGTITGLQAGTSIILRNNNVDLSFTSTGSPIPFTFPPLANGSSYNVTVSSQPQLPKQSGQLCTVSNGSGTATTDVTNVNVQCVTAYTISVGSVTGFNGTTLVLQNNGADDLPILANGGPFIFNTPVAAGGSYAVTVSTYPSSQVCTVTNGSGTSLTGPVTNVSVTCAEGYTVGGNVRGLASSGLRLKYVSDVPTTDFKTVNSSGAFTFPTPLAVGKSYTVSVATQPSAGDQTCTVSGGATGTIPGGGPNITNVVVDCPPPPPTVSVTYDIKQIKFSWSAVTGATRYEVSKNPDGSSGYTTVTPANYTGTSFSDGLNGTDCTAGSQCILPVHLLDWPSIGYQVSACNAVNLCTAATSYNSQASSAFFPGSANSYKSIGYVKASNTLGPTNLGQIPIGQNFGKAVAVSGDGNTIAIGAQGEASNATGISGNQSDTSMVGAGAVYVFVRNTSTGVWTQQAYVKASDTHASGAFGSSVALSDDGTTLAVGAADKFGASGTAYVFTRSGTTWEQQGSPLKPSTLNTSLSCQDDGTSGAWYSFGSSISLSGDGNILAVGAPTESSASSNPTFTCGNSPPPSNHAAYSGAVYIFGSPDTNGNRAQQAYIKASDTVAGKNFGNAVALSSNGDTLAVGAWQDSGTTISGSGGKNKSGAVYVFTQNVGTWSQQSKLKASNAGVDVASICNGTGGPGGAQFGAGVAISGDGTTIAAGANGEAGDGTSPSTQCGSGAAYVFTGSGSSWTQQAYIKPQSFATNMFFGAAVGLSSDDGDTLIVGSPSEGGSTRGVDVTNSGSAQGAGAAYAFRRSSGTWSTLPVSGNAGYIKASNPTANSNFGFALAISSDGRTLIVGAYTESGNAKGVTPGGSSNGAAINAGAAYLY